MAGRWRESPVQSNYVTDSLCLISVTTFGTFLVLYCWRRRVSTFMIGGYLPVSIQTALLYRMSTNLIIPELQMRRPGMPKYRLDNLLERKAKEGVKIYIIL